MDRTSFLSSLCTRFGARAPKYPIESFVQPTLPTPPPLEIQIARCTKPHSRCQCRNVPQKVRPYIHTYFYTIIHTITRMHTVLHLIKLFGSYVLTYTQTSLSITLSAPLHTDFSVKHSAPIGHFNLLLFFFLLARFFFHLGARSRSALACFQRDSGSEYTKSTSQSVISLVAFSLRSRYTRYHTELCTELLHAHTHVAGILLGSTLTFTLTLEYLSSVIDFSLSFFLFCFILQFVQRDP